MTQMCYVLYRFPTESARGGLGNVMQALPSPRRMKTVRSGVFVGSVKHFCQCPRERAPRSLQQYPLADVPGPGCWSTARARHTHASAGRSSGRVPLRRGHCWGWRGPAGRGMGGLPGRDVGKCHVPCNPPAAIPTHSSAICQGIFLPFTTSRL